MFSIAKVARDQTKPGSLLARPRGRLDERPWERGCFLDLYFWEFAAAIKFPCSMSWMKIGENDVIF